MVIMLDGISSSNLAKLILPGCSPERINSINNSYDFDEIATDITASEQIKEHRFPRALLSTPVTPRVVMQKLHQRLSPTDKEYLLKMCLKDYNSASYTQIKWVTLTQCLTIELLFLAIASTAFNALTANYSYMEKIKSILNNLHITKALPITLIAILSVLLSVTLFLLCNAISNECDISKEREGIKKQSIRNFVAADPGQGIVSEFPVSVKRVLSSLFLIKIADDAEHRIVIPTKNPNHVRPFPPSFKANKDDFIAVVIPLFTMLLCISVITASMLCEYYKVLSPGIASKLVTSMLAIFLPCYCFFSLILFCNMANYKDNHLTLSPIFDGTFTVQTRANFGDKSLEKIYLYPDAFSSKREAIKIISDEVFHFRKLDEEHSASKKDTINADETNDIQDPEVKNLRAQEDSLELCT